MRIRSPRLFAVVAFVLLCLPMLAGVLQGRRSDLSQSEGRVLAPWPHRPVSSRDWRALPAALDAFMADHFGLRDTMIRLQSTVAYLWLGEAHPDVLIGRGGRLFFYGDDAIAQSAGRTLRRDAVRHTIDIVTEMQALLSARGIRLVIASPPNAASVYDDDLPAWARNDGRDTEPDLVLNALKARGSTVVDLRGRLRAERDRGNLYLRSDTHWTLLGAVLGYDAIASAAGHPDWSVEPDAVIGPPTRFDTGDLARMLGVDRPETIGFWSTQSGPVEVVGPPGRALQVSKGVAGGPAVLILGDSFTEGTFAALMEGHAGRIGWLGARSCDFDWSWIDRFKPDEVWWAPTERLLPCDPQTWPQGFPRGPAGSGGAEVRG